MQETYTRREAAEALGIGLRTLYDWRKAAGILKDAEGYAPLSRAEVEMLAVRHKRIVKELQPEADPASLAARITQLEQQVKSLQEQMNQVSRLVIAQLAGASSTLQSQNTTSPEFPVSDAQSESGR